MELLSILAYIGSLMLWAVILILAIFGLFSALFFTTLMNKINRINRRAKEYQETVEQ